MISGAIDIEDIEAPQRPGIQRALGLTACVAIRSGATGETLKFYNAQANTGTARFAQLQLALAATSPNDVIELRNGSFLIPNGVSMSMFSPADGVKVVCAPGATHNYQDPEMACNDYRLFSGERKAIDFGVTPLGSGQAPVDSWAGLQACSNSLDTLYPAPNVITLESGRILRTGSILLPQGYLYISQTWFISPTVVVRGPGPNFCAIWLMDGVYDELPNYAVPASIVEHWAIKFERGALIGAGPNREIADNDCFGTGLEYVYVNSGFNFDTGISANRSASGVHLIGAQRCRLHRVTITGFGLRGAFFQGSTLYDLQIANIQRGPGIDITQSCSIGVVASEHINRNAIIDPATGEVYPAIQITGARGFSAQNFVFEEHGLDGSSANVQHGIRITNCIGGNISAVTFGIGLGAREHTAVRITGPTAGITVDSAIGNFGGSTPVDIGKLVHDDSDSSPAGAGISHYVDGPWLSTPYDQGMALSAAALLFLKTPTSANLRALISDETGSGAAVFATSPTLVSPTLGNATATSITVNSAGFGGANAGANVGGQITKLAVTGYTGLDGLRVSGSDGTNTIYQTDAATPLAITTNGGDLRLGASPGSGHLIIQSSGAATFSSNVSAAEYRVSGNKVLSARGAAVADALTAAGAPTQSEFNALVGVVNTLLSRLRSTTGHGLIT